MFDPARTDARSKQARQFSSEQISCADYAGLNPKQSWTLGCRWRTHPYSSTAFIPALCRSDAKGYLLPDFYSGATGIPSRFSGKMRVR